MLIETRVGDRFLKRNIGVINFNTALGIEAGINIVYMLNIEAINVYVDACQ